MSSPRARNASSLGMSKTICDCTKVAPAATFRCSSRSSRSRPSANGLTTAPTASECGTLHPGALAISSVAVMSATWSTPATGSPCMHSTPSAPSAAAPTTCDCNASRLRSRQETCTIVPTPCSRARATAANGDIRGWPAWLSVNPTTSTVSARTAMRSLTRWPSASAGSEISADVRAVTDTGESSQPDAPETRRGRRKKGRQTSLSRSRRSRRTWTISQTAAANDWSARVTTAGRLSSSELALVVEHPLLHARWGVGEALALVEAAGARVALVDIHLHQACPALTQLLERALHQRGARTSSASIRTNVQLVYERDRAVVPDVFAKRDQREADRRVAREQRECGAPS